VHFSLSSPVTDGRGKAEVAAMFQACTQPSTTNHLTLSHIVTLSHSSVLVTALL